MKTMRRAIALLFAAFLLVSFSCAYAEETGPEKWPVIDSAVLDAMIEDNLSKMKVDAKSVSVAMYYTGSGEYYYFNADNWIYSASLYKMPVCMTYSHGIKDGEFTANTMSRTDDSIFERILGHSDYSWVTRLEKYMYGDRDCIVKMRKQDLEYAHFDEAQLPRDYFKSSKYSARFYLGIIEELYNNSDEYPKVIEYLTGATPTKYFCRNLGDKYPVAQKYGSDNGVVHAAGIIYTDNPILLVIMTDNKADSVGNRIIGTLSENIVECIEEWSSSGE